MAGGDALQASERTGIGAGGGGKRQEKTWENGVDWSGRRRGRTNKRQKGGGGGGWRPS